jgi:hypothetical protein
MVAAIPALAQKKALHGIVTDKSSNQPLGMAGIRNVYSGSTAITHRDGSFIIDASAGAVIAVTANGFYSDTLTVNDSLFTGGVINLSLRALPSTLDDVTVTSTYNQYQRDSLARRRNFLQTVGDHKISTISRPNDSKDFGVALNLDHFSKREKDKRYARSLFDITEEEAYINFRWNEQVVTKYTQYRDDDLSAFMQKARPGYEWLRKHGTEEDLLYYINSQLKKYRK